MIEYPNHLKSPPKQNSADDLSSLGSNSSSESKRKDQQLDEALRLARIVLGKDHASKSDSKTFLSAIREVASLKQNLQKLERERNLLRCAVKRTSLLQRSASCTSLQSSATLDTALDSTASDHKPHAVTPQTTIEDIKMRLVCWKTAFHNLNQTHEKLLHKCHKDLKQIDSVLKNHISDSDAEVTAETLEHLHDLVHTVLSFPTSDTQLQQKCKHQETRIEQLEQQLQQMQFQLATTEILTSSSSSSMEMPQATTTTHKTRPISPTDTARSSSSSSCEDIGGIIMTTATTDDAFMIFDNADDDSDQDEPHL